MAGGCGDTHGAAKTPLPHELAQKLRSLEGHPAALLQAAIREVNAGHVPAAAQEELLSRANAFAERPTDAHRRSLDALLRR